MDGSKTWIQALRGSVEAISRRSLLRAFAIVLMYGAMLAASFWLAYLLRFEFQLEAKWSEQLSALIVPVVVCKLFLLASFGQFRSVLSYFGRHDFGCVVASTGLVSAAMLVLFFFSQPMATPPRSVILVDFLISVGGLTTARLMLQIAHDRIRLWDARGQRYQRRIGIVGAGDMGSALASDLISRQSFGLQPVIFFDDNPRKWNRSLHGIPIIGPISSLPERVLRARITEVIITMPSAGPKKLKEVVDLAQRAGLKASIVPSFTQLASGEVRVDRFRPVEIDDLLGRQPVNLDSDHIEELLRDRVVLVTGAGGSIGRELCRQIAACKVRRLLLFEQSEVQLFQIELELVNAGYGGVVVPLIADILDAPRLHHIFSEYRPQIVFHAAAHKHVFMMERQPAEAVKNNFLGTARLAQAAREFGVAKFVLISTDKAINPTSVMGASKRLAEYAILGNQGRQGNRTAFMAVRFGNVLGSSGSVIPIFKQQIAAGGPVTVTHPEATRYFMTIPEAVGLLLQAATMGKGGEIYVLDMGTPLRIVDVARQLIELSGFRPEVDIEIRMIGLRPGEKLFEEVQHAREALEATDHPRVFQLTGTAPSPSEVDKCLAELVGGLFAVDAHELKRLMQKWIPEYTPYFGAADGEEKVAWSDAAPVAGGGGVARTVGRT